MTRFVKAHAYGNDFLYLLRSDVGRADLTAAARELCDRHTGVGADGLIVYERTSKGAAIQLFNADGGEAEVSGNGVRALAAILGRDEDTLTVEFAIETAGGVKRLRRT